MKAIYKQPLPEITPKPFIQKLNPPQFGEDLIDFTMGRSLASVLDEINKPKEVKKKMWGWI